MIEISAGHGFHWGCSYWVVASGLECIPRLIISLYDKNYFYYFFIWLILLIAPMRDLFHIAILWFTSILCHVHLLDNKKHNNNHLLNYCFLHSTGITDIWKTQLVDSLTLCQKGVWCLQGKIFGILKCLSMCICYHSLMQSELLEGLVIMCSCRDLLRYRACSHACWRCSRKRTHSETVLHWSCVNGEVPTFKMKLDC